eukprot:s1278_g14.t2
MPATKPKKSSSSSSDSESETPPKKKTTTKKAASVSPKKTTKTAASKATTKATTKTTTATKKRESSPKPKKRAASPARASPKPKKRAQKASPEPKKRKASPEPKKRKASPEPSKKRRSRTPVKKTVTKRKEESSSYRSGGSSDSRSRSRPPPKRKAPAREASPKVKEKVRKENGSTARAAPQARSFLGALKAVKANQKDMPKPPEDSWAKGKHKDGETKEVWDPTNVCGHPDCDLQVSSDRLVSEGETKANPPPADPSAGGGNWKKKTSGMRWGSYGNGKSYGKAWSQWTPAESKEQTKGLRAWSDDDEPPVKGTNAAKKAQEKEEKEKDKDKGENSDAWSKWNSGGNSGYSGSGWKKSENWSEWSGGWKSSWSGSWNRGNQSKGWGNSQRGGGTEMLSSVEEAEERRQKLGNAAVLGDPVSVLGG